MKTAIYIEDGKTQFVLTPETEIDKRVLSEIEEAQSFLKTFRGSFYECRAGYVRQSEDWAGHFYTSAPRSDSSLILFIDHRAQEVAAARAAAGEPIIKSAVLNPMGASSSTQQPFIPFANEQINLEDERR